MKEIQELIPIDNGFEVDFVNAIAEKEAFNKHLYRPNTYLHKWWARRSGTTFRAILKQLVSDPLLRDFYSPGGLEGKIILDPMMGGGTTLHEAIRLGANVIGADIDPIPVLQARATLTDVRIEDIREDFSRLMQSLREELGHYYQAFCPVCARACYQRFVLYGLKKVCDCGEALFIDSYELRHNHDGSVIHISPDTYDVLINGEVYSQTDQPYSYPLYTKTTRRCPHGHAFTELTDIPYYQRYVPIAVVGECPNHGLFFSAIQSSDLDSIRHADKHRSSLPFSESEFKIVAGPKSGDLVKRGIKSYLDLFSSRQLLFLHHAIIHNRALDHVSQLKLGLLISTSLEFNSMLCGYKGGARSRPGAIRHTFAQHAYSFPYTALENNPLHPSRSSGTLNNLFESRIVSGYQWARMPLERDIRNSKVTTVPIRGELDVGHEYKSYADLETLTRRFLLLQGSSSTLPLPDESIDHIVTDPPYFDSVQYGDLAAYFHVWLRRLLPAEAKWDYALEDSAIDQQKNGNGQFEYVLGNIFLECNRVLRSEGGRLIFTYHHWNPKGWAALTIALQRAGFSLVNRYVIHAENPSSVHIANQNALIHDVILVLGKSGTFSPSSWTPPSTIKTRDSRQFCELCGTLIGYLLNTTNSEDEIRKVWMEAISSETPA